MQPMADSYVADVPVAGEEVSVIFALHKCLVESFSAIRGSTLSLREVLTLLCAQAKWYALVANAEFMLHDVQNEAFAEQLRERVRLFGEKDRKLDFFLVCEPRWLDEKFPQEAKRVGRPCVALVSTDKIWITYITPLIPPVICCSRHLILCCCSACHSGQPHGLEAIALQL